MARWSEVVLGSAAAHMNETHDRKLHLLKPQPPSPKERMTTLGRTFPSLGKKPGIDPFDAVQLDRWAAGVASHGESITARFLLSVWDGGSRSDWLSEPFHLLEALKIWDEAHHAAFLAWAADPWWP